MAQESPTRLLYAQIGQMLSQLQKSFSIQSAKQPTDVSASLNNIITKFMEQAGSTLTVYEPVKKSEVPSSSKMNRFWSSLQDDINILQDQVDILNASTVFAHNMIKMDILKAKSENFQLQNKLKALQLYSSIDNDSLIYFGDSFITDDFIDWDYISEFERGSIENGFLTLKVLSTSSAFDSNTTIRILPGSNGFLGNNQEIADPASSTTDPITGQKMYRFVSEISNSSDIRKILDNKPTTWVEFEKYLISQQDRSRAKNFNFEYILTSNTNTAYLFSSNDSAITKKSNGNSLISWADGISSGSLKFYFEIDLLSTKQVNVISLLPYGLVDNINNPIKIVKVSVSSDRTFWDVLNPENIWIANGIDKKVITINKELISLEKVIWTYDGDPIRFIKFEIEQPNSIPCRVGHLYYVENDSPAVNTPNYAINIPVTGTNLYESDTKYDSHIVYGGPSTTESNQNTIDIKTNSVVVNQVSNAIETTIQDENYRVLGPNPPVTDIQMYNSPNKSKVNGLLQKREYFQGRRWAIGIRDISVMKNNYDVSGTVISKRFDIPGIVDRVSLEADITIPEGYDNTDVWIKFYISPDDGLTWHRISRIQDDYLNVPEIIAYNDPTPKDLREPGVGYFSTASKVNSLRVKIEITRPSSEVGTTPIVNSYKLKVLKKG